MWRWMLAGLLMAPAWPAGAKVLYAENFEHGTGGWVNGDTAAEPPTTGDAVGRAGSALVSRFDIAANARPHVLTLTGVPAWTGARSVRLWVRTDAATLLGVVLAAPGGTRTVAAAFSPANTWQHLEISVDRFRALEDSYDFIGPDELKEIGTLGILDLAGRSPGAPATARRATLWLAGVQVDDEEAPTAYSVNHKLPLVLDNFETDLVSWIAVRGSLTHDARAGEMVWRYPAKKSTQGNTVLLDLLGPVAAAGAAHLLLTLRSSHPRQLAVVLAAQRHGGNSFVYLKTVAVPAGDNPITLTLRLADFQFQGPDKDAKPVAQVVFNLLVLLDIDVEADHADGENTLALSEVMLTAD